MKPLKILLLVALATIPIITAHAVPTQIDLAQVPRPMTPEEVKVWGPKFQEETKAKSEAKKVAQTILSGNEKQTQTGLSVLHSTHSPLATSHFFYTGKPFIEETSAYAFRFRSYDPELNRWTSADPSGFPNGANNFAYCGNLPISFFDPTGLAYDPQGLTNSELLSLSRALNLWLIDFNTVFYPGVWWEERTQTLSFVTRYKWKYGDQTLDYSNISSTRGIAGANQYAENQIKSGNINLSNYNINGASWGNQDISTSLGSVTVSYSVENKGNNLYSVNCTIEDIYDFHGSSSIGFPFLSLEGLFVGWDGGDVVYDLWMKQLADAGYAKEFKTTIQWSFQVKIE